MEKISASSLLAQKKFTVPRECCGRATFKRNAYHSKPMLGIVHRNDHIFAMDKLLFG